MSRPFNKKKEYDKIITLHVFYTVVFLISSGIRRHLQSGDIISNRHIDKWSIC